MRLLENLGTATRRLLLAPVCVFGFASIVATGGSSGGGGPPEDLREEAGAIRLSDETLTVVAGGEVRLRVDIDGLPQGRAASGYSIDLSESVSRIDIQTSACPPDTGTASCRDWTITPARDALPGSYAMEISAVGTGTIVERAEVVIEVIGELPLAQAATLATERLVMTTDGALWATGWNGKGQSGLGFWNGCEATSVRCIQPGSIKGFVRVGQESWIDAAASFHVSLAVRSDGTVWKWGSPVASELPRMSDVDLRPRQVTELPEVTRVSMASTHAQAQRHQYEQYLALSEGGWVYAWDGTGGFQHIDGEERNTRDPRRIPMAVTSDGVETPLDNVVAIAGGTDNTGSGFALALRGDGSVWHWGGGAFYQEWDSEFRTGPGMPARVAGLNGAVKSIAVGEVLPTIGAPRKFALAAMTNGEVMTWDEDAPNPQPVAGLADIAEVAADFEGNAAARGDDGSMWFWRPGSSVPTQVSGIPTVVRLGRGTPTRAIVADCGGSEGSVWHVAESFGAPITRRLAPFGASCPTIPAHRFTVQRSGEGSVITDPLFINCGALCTSSVPSGSYLELTFTPAPGWKLTSNTGCEHGRIDADRTCIVTFEPRPLPRTLSVEIVGVGRVVSDSPGIDCPGDCTNNYSAEIPTPETVRLTATAGTGFRFTGFQGDAGCANRNLRMDISRHCKAVFEAYPTPAAPAGLTATPGSDSVRLGWTAITDGSVVSYALTRAEGTGAFNPVTETLGGAASAYLDVNVVPGREYTYRLTATNLSGSSAPTSVTATVPTALSVTLTVQVTGPGRVASSTAGIDCPADCTQAYATVANVTLNAFADSNGRFDGWGGACAGTAPSTIVTMDDNKTCTATFTAVSEGGWETLVSQLASSQERDVRSSLVLNDAGSVYVAYIQTVGTQNRLTVRLEGPGFPILSTLNANATWSATGFELALDPAGAPLLIFNMDLQDVMVVRWSGSQWDGLPPSTTPVPPQRMNLTAGGGSRVQIARRGNTLVAAWIEAQQITMRRYDFVTNQWDSGAFVPGPTNPFDIDLALDTNGLAVIAWSDGLLGSRLHAIRETGPGTWTPLGGDIGVRPATSEMVMEFGIHVDTSNAIRLVWLEGDNGYYVSVAQFDGAAWGPLPGRTNMDYFFHPYPVRSLSVNRNPALFAFAFEWDQNDSLINGLIATRQLVGGQLTMVGSLESTIHPRVGHLSLAMNEADRATIAQSEYTPADMTYGLVIRRHVP